MPKNKKVRAARLRFRLLIGAVLLLVAAYSLYWFQAAGRYEAKLRAWAAQAESQGFRVKYSNIHISGFPYRLVASFDDFLLSRSRPGYGWGVSAPEASLITLAWHQSQMILDMPAAQLALSFDWPRKNGLAERSLTATAKALRASLRLGAEARIERLSIDMSDAQGQLPALGDFQVQDVQFHSWRAHPGEHGAAPADRDPNLPEQREIALKVRNLDLPDIDDNPLGKKLDYAQLVIGVDAESQPALAPEDIAAWRDAGGSLDVKDVILKWNGFEIEGSGDAALDDAFRPIGAFNSRAKGVDRAIAALKRRPDVAPGTIELAELTYQLLQNSARQQGAKDHINLAFSLQDGYLYAGPVPVFEIGPVSYLEKK